MKTPAVLFLCTTIVLLFMVNACTQQNVTNTTDKQVATDSIKVETFQTGNGWGYDIFMHDKKVIHQENIPAVNGLFQFRTEADAKRTGEFAKLKIKKNIFPPTISTEELDSLGIAP